MGLRRPGHCAELAEECRFFSLCDVDHRIVVQDHLSASSRVIRFQFRHVHHVRFMDAEKKIGRQFGGNHFQVARADELLFIPGVNNGVDAPGFQPDDVPNGDDMFGLVVGNDDVIV